MIRKLACIGGSLAGLLVGAPAWAQATGSSGAFPWWRVCQNPKLVDLNLGPWQHGALALWLLVLLGGVAVAAISIRRARRDSNWLVPIKREWLGWLVLLAYVLVFGRRSIGLGEPDGVHQILDAVRIPEQLAPFDAILYGGWADLVRLFGPSAELVLWVNGSLALVGLALAYALSLLAFGNRRFGLVAAYLGGGTLVFLAHMAVSLPLHLGTTAALSAACAYLLCLRKNSRWLVLPALVLATLAAFLFPAAAFVLLLLIPAGTKSELRPAAVRLLTGFWVIALLGGELLHLGLTQRLPLDFSFVLLGDLGGMTFVELAALLVGVSIVVRKRLYLPLSLVLAGLAALVVLPVRPAGLLSDGGWAWLGVALLLPITARGVWELAAWVTPKKSAWIVAVILAGVLIPNAIAVWFLPSSEYDQTYGFERGLFTELSGEQTVLYMDVIRNPTLPAAASFLAPHGGPLCLRDREHLIRDPKSHGARWIYFGPECSLESPFGGDDPRSCRFYRNLYELAGCRKTPLNYYSPRGEISFRTELEACRVVGVKADGRPPEKSGSATR